MGNSIQIYDSTYENTTPTNNNPLLYLFNLLHPLTCAMLLCL